MSQGKLNDKIKVKKKDYFNALQELRNEAFTRLHMPINIGNIIYFKDYVNKARCRGHCC